MKDAVSKVLDEFSLDFSRKSCLEKILARLRDGFEDSIKIDDYTEMSFNFSPRMCLEVELTTTYKNKSKSTAELIIGYRITEEEITADDIERELNYLTRIHSMNLGNIVDNSTLTKLTSHLYSLILDHLNNGLLDQMVSYVDTYRDYLILNKHTEEKAVEYSRNQLSKTTASWLLDKLAIGMKVVFDGEVKTITRIDTDLSSYPWVTLNDNKKIPFAVLDKLKTWLLYNKEYEDFVKEIESYTKPKQ